MYKWGVNGRSPGRLTVTPPWGTSPHATRNCWHACAGSAQTPGDQTLLSPPTYSGRLNQLRKDSPSVGCDPWLMTCWVWAVTAPLPLATVSGRGSAHTPLPQTVGRSSQHAHVWSCDPPKLGTTPGHEQRPTLAGFLPKVTIMDNMHNRAEEQRSQPH